KGLRPLREEGHVDEWRVRGDEGAAPLNSDIEKDVGRRRQNGVGGETKEPERSCLGYTVAGAACGDHRLANRHAITLHQLWSAVIYCQGNGEQNKANHEKCAVMNATPHHFSHLLSNDAGHGVDRLKKSA